MRNEKRKKLPSILQINQAENLPTYRYPPKKINSHFPHADSMHSRSPSIYLKGYVQLR